MNNKKGEYIMKNPEREEMAQLVLEEILDDLCILVERQIFVMLPENQDERIPYLKKEIIKTLEKL